MPAAIAIPAIATAIAGGTAATASIYGANKQSSANKAAAAASERSNAAAIAVQREKDAQDKAAFDSQQKQQADQFKAQQDFQTNQWNQQQQLLAAQDARKDPYRQASRAALLHLSDLLGINIGSGGVDPGVAAQASAARIAPTPSQGFMPNAPVSPVNMPTQPNYRPVIPMAALYRPTGAQ